MASTLPILLLCVAAWLSYYTFNRIRLRLIRKALERQHGCEPPASVFPSKDPWTFNFVREVVPAIRQGRLLPYFHSLHEQYGKTYILQPLLGRTIIFSNEAENIKCVNSDRFNDWTVHEGRQEAVGAILGDGIFTTDGPAWSHSRALIRPQFERSQVTEQTAHFEAHIPSLVANIGDGETIDLQDLFHRFTMDTSTEFLTGTSTRSLDADQADKSRQFIESFEYSMADAQWRVRLGRLYYLKPDFKAFTAIKYARSYVKEWVDRAVAHRDSLSAEEKTQKDSGPYVFINELAKQEGIGVERIHNETMNVLLAGRDTTASLLSHMWFVLARRPDVWEKLQAEVDALQGDLPNYTQLKEMKFMKNVVRETLRMYPPVPSLSKRAARDTVLPRGGGVDGTKPLLVRKGSAFTAGYWSLQRDPEVYGPDSHEFRPERWEDPLLRPFWSNIPFGGGPRVCLGQQYALSEAYYVTTRLMQHFRNIQPRDSEGWKGKVSVTCSLFNGTKVALSR